MAEDARSIRRTAKARFTRKRNELLKSMNADQGREMVEGNYVKLSEAWDIVESKHDLYTMHLTDEELEVAESWITELQDLFAEATALKIQYIQNSVRSEIIARENTLRHESEMKESAERERKAEKALIRRMKAQTVFDTICSNTKHFLDNNIASHILERSLKQIEDAYADCRSANDDVLDLADRDTVENAIKFAAQIQCQLADMTEKLTLQIGPKDDTVAKREPSTSSNLQLEKIKLPRFEGEIRAYPQFKRDFEKQIMPHLQSDDVSYVLRSCLGSDPAAIVNSVDDDISEMWSRLDEKYGDPAKVADVIIDGIRRTRILREGEEKRFVEFVEIVEDGYRDLKRLGLESEITTTSSVSIIEKKLPADIRRKWAEIVSADNSTVDKTNKFPSLLKFLRSQRGAIEYDTASLRVPAGTVKALIHHTTAKEEIDIKDQRMTQGKCLIHEGGKHSTEQCKVYSSKSIDEKRTLLKDKNACWSCLKVGHRSRVCRAKRICNIKDCPLTHHPSLHEERQTLKNAAKELTSKDVETAEVFWIKEAQQNMKHDIKHGTYRRLCPRLRDDGIYVISGRAEKWLEIGYNKEDLILLPYKHRFARLYCEYIHAKGHHGVLTTASKIRARFWITKLLKMMQSVKLNCVTCKKLDKKLSGQVMGNLPKERLKPAPPWYSTSIDLYGPFTIRDAVKKRTTSKAYGVIFNCIGTRAVYLDLASDYSTESFLMVLRRFVSLRGYPSKIYSDNGAQLVAASQELKNVTKFWDWEKLKSFGVMEGFEWNFTPADAPWQNGTSESLIRSVKRSLKAAIGESILTFSELQTVLFEVANLINERPIGRHPRSPEDGSYLCPNDLLLGRSTARVPSGPFRESTNPRFRFEFIQNIVNSFWKRWTTNYFPDLIVRQKWHTAHRNLKTGDIVLIQDSNLVRGQWRLGIVSNTFPGCDGKVRKVEVQYKNPKQGEPVTKYQGRGYVTIERPVHRLVLLIPKDDISDF